MNKYNILGNLESAINKYETTKDKNEMIISQKFIMSNFFKDNTNNKKENSEYLYTNII